MKPADGRVTYLRGWPAAKWWASPNLFWDDFTEDGQLGPEVDTRTQTGALCLQREIPAGADASYTFMLAWHFPNRTAAWSGWTAPKGHENDNLGNYYCVRFADAWEAARQAAAGLLELERRTRSFVNAMRQSSLPGALRDAAVANLSTLVTQTAFRTADGDFHGFEGCDDHRGCCFGNCTHVWNYETATQFLFPSFARSLRKASFGFSQDDQGGMRFRQMLPDGIDRFGYAAADGQMGQIIKTYLDWKLCGDTDWLRGLWPQVQKGLSFAWIPGGWDANRDGVMEGVQHNTYDVEFYGPNPLGTVYYLGALRAAEEMARALGDSAAAADYHALFLKGSAWVDQNLFNGEFYVQQVRGIPKSEIAQATIGDMGSDRPDAAGVPAGERLPRRPVDRPIPGGSRRPRPAAGTGQHPQDARIHPQVQLSRATGRPRFGAARLRPERRTGAAGLRLHARAAVPESPSPTIRKPGPESNTWSRRSSFTRACCARDWERSKMSGAASTASAAIRGTSRNAAITTRARCQPGRA